LFNGFVVFIQPWLAPYSACAGPTQAGHDTTQPVEPIIPKPQLEWSIKWAS